MRRNGARVNLHRRTVDAANAGTQGFQNFQGHGDIADVREIFNTANAFRQNDGGQNRYRGIFRAADLHFTVQTVTADDPKFFQPCFPPFPYNHKQ